MISEETLFLSDDKIFYTIEGEGRYVGRPSVFMRLSMCNLTCKGFASKDSPHGCDSYISWSVKNNMTFSEILKMMEENGYVDRLAAGAIWKITGGEPLIQQKKLLKLFMFAADEWGFLPHIDFETNGTLIPCKEFGPNYFHIDQNITYTVSPKLSNNGDPIEKRYNEKALEWHSDNIYGLLKTESTFKFVVKDLNDISEILADYVSKFNISNNRVWLMPCAGSRSEHTEVCEMVAELAKQYNFNFSPRLQLVIWDKALKV